MFPLAFLQSELLSAIDCGSSPWEFRKNYLHWKFCKNHPSCKSNPAQEFPFAVLIGNLEVSIPRAVDFLIQR